MKTLNVSNGIKIFILLLLPLICFPADNTPLSPASSPGQDLNQDALIAVRDFLRKDLEADNIVGAEILIIKNRKALLHDAYGWKDREDSLTMVKNTVFNIRSMSKTFTAAGIQILINQGKLKLDDKAATYLRGFRGGKSQTITIEHLLTHRSGLPISIITDFKDFNKYNSLIDMANAIGETGPETEPGTRFQYSDAGVEVLGSIIEIVCGMPLYEFLNEVLFSPLQMTDTYPVTGLNRKGYNRIASLYGGTSGNWKKFWTPRDAPIYPFTCGSQSFYCTPMDYARFLNMIMAGGIPDNQEILTREAVKRILTPTDEFILPGTEMTYRTGFPDYKVFHGQMSMLFINQKNRLDDQPLIFGYGGSDGTFGWVCPETELIVLYFSQSRNFLNPFPFREFEKMLYRNFINPGWKENQYVIPEKYKRYLGYYSPDGAARNDAKFKILVENENLALEIPGKGIFELNNPDDEGLWIFKITDLLAVSFVKNKTGNITGLLLHQSTPFPKINEENPAEEIKSEYSDYLGTYKMLPLNKEIHLIRKNNQLAIRFSDTHTAELTPPDSKGRWFFKNSNNCIYFGSDKGGRILSFYLVERLRLSRID